MQTNRVVTTGTRQMQRVLIAAIAVSALLLATRPAQAGEKTIYTLTSSGANSPEDQFVADSNGVLYGTACCGGSANLGAVFSLTPPGKGQTTWTETLLYSFQGGSDGDFPTGSLTPDGSGGYFGTAAFGGDGSCILYETAGCGIVFHLTPPGEGQTNWTESVLYSFQGSSADGAHPYDGLLRDSATGVLYGATYGIFVGAGTFAGTVFSLTPPGEGQTNWTLAVLYAFTGGADGGFPWGHVIADSTGALYGTTTSGGDPGYGTLFKLTPPSEGQTKWTESVLYGFQGFAFSDGSAPYAGLIFDASGNLYGTTTSGGFYDYGTVFELSLEPPGGCPSESYPGNGWCESQLYAFGGGKDGALAASDLIMDANGALYGTTAAGGKFNDGTVFKLTPPSWTEKLLASFNGTDGAFPLAGLLAQKVGTKVVLYGNTFNDGGTSCPGGCGSVYEITGSGFVF